MFKKVKSLLSLFICISVLCTVMPITSYAADAAENVASVTFDGNTEYYTTIDDAWNAAVALDTTLENKATIKLLADCTSNSMLNLVYDYFILDTNNKTLTGTSKLEYNNSVYSVIYVDGGSLEIIGNGTITGYTKSDYTKGILIVNNGVAYIDGVTVYNTGTGGAYGVFVRNGGDFYLLDGHIISAGEYALSAGTWDVYLYSGKIESSGRCAMTVRSRFHICYSDKPIYLINNDVKNKDMIIYSSEPIDYIMLLDDHVGVDLEYSQNPDGSNPISLKNVKKLSYTINHNTSYLKFQTFRQNTITVNATEGGTASSSSTDVRTGESVTLTATADEGYTFDGWYDGDTKVCDTAEFTVENVTTDKTYTAKFTKNLLPESKLFSVSTGDSSLIKKINRDGVTDIRSTEITAVHFVDLTDYDLTNISYSDYSARGDGSVKAWMDGTELYIGGYGKIIAGKSLAFAFMNGFKIDKITGLEMLDTSNVTDMSFMFYSCGRYSQVFTLDLGNNFDTSNVTNMSYMFYSCGNESAVFTLDLGEKFDTSNVTDMHYMFSSCGVCSQVFTLDLGDKFNTSKVTDMKEMFRSCGSASKLFTLNLGDKFDTSNVADMRLMFHGCGIQSSAFTTLDLSKFTVGANTKLDEFAYGSNVKTFIFGDGWANASLPSAGSEKGAFYADSQISTTVTGATEKLLNYDWASDNRIVNGLKPQTYTVTANAETGGTVSGGGEVADGGNITLTATANEGYTFDGWYDGDTKVCDATEFTVENITADKTYTAKFTKNQIVEPDPEPSKFDFTSLRTLKTKNITVNHETKTIDIDASDNTDFVTIFVHQKDVIPGGTFKMASYLGNKVVYDKNGSYRIYYVHNFTVPVKANITINGVTEQYSVNVHFDSSKAGFDFTSLKGKNFSDATVNHDDKTVHITANDNTDEIILYVNQHDTVYGGKLRMASYLGNKVNYNNAGGVYTIYANGKNSVSVKANIEINGVTEQYLITVDFPAVSWGFDAVNAENVKNVSIDHENKVITIDTTEGADSILLYIDQICRNEIKGQIWMKSYMGNKVVYNAADRTYTIAKKDKNSITVKTKITMLGETRYYDININFTENE